MRNEPLRGEESGVTYSGYTLFAGELEYDSFDNGEVGYKVRSSRATLAFSSVEISSYQPFYF